MVHTLEDNKKGTGNAHFKVSVLSTKGQRNLQGYSVAFGLMCFMLASQSNITTLTMINYLVWAFQFSLVNYSSFVQIQMFGDMYSRVESSQPKIEYIYIYIHIHIYIYIFIYLFI